MLKEQEEILMQKVVSGEKLTAEELTSLMELDRPLTEHVRPTGRTTRTGSAAKPTTNSTRAQRIAKWEARKSG